MVLGLCISASIIILSRDSVTMQEVLIPIILFLGVYFWLTNREKFKPIDTNLAKIFSVQLLLKKIRINYLDIRIDKVFLAKSLACLILAILLFVTQTITELPPASRRCLWP